MENNVRTISGKLKVLSTKNKKLFPIEIMALNSEVNHNNWKYINLEQHKKEFMNIPVLTAYVRNKVGDGHNFDMKIDPQTGKEYASFTAPDAERIVGWIDEKEENVRLETIDGVEWVIVKGYLWAWYAKELVDKIVRQGDMSVSIETLITAEHKDGDVDVEDSYIVLGITVLGDDVNPAVEGANIMSLNQLQEIRSNMQKEIIKAASYIVEANSTEPKIENKKPSKTKGVTSKMIAKNVLKSLAKKFEGFTAIDASEDGLKVVLLSANNEPFGYAFAESDKGTVVNDRICPAVAEVNFKFNGEEVVTSLDAVVGHLASQIESLQGENKTLSESNDSLNATISEMQKKERSRRLECAKSAMFDELKVSNENLSEEDKFSVDILKDLQTRIENNEFTDMEDKDGNWIGENAVRDAVAVLCEHARRERDAEAAKSQKHTFNWGLPQNNSKSEPKTIGEKLAN